MKSTGPNGDYKMNENYTHTYVRARPYWVMSGRELTCYTGFTLYKQARKFSPSNQIRCTVINRTNDGNCEHTHTHTKFHNAHTCVYSTRANFLPTINFAHKKFSNPFTHGETIGDGDDDSEQNRTNAI